MSGRTLMAVFAHPDDEAFSVSGTLAHYAAQGDDVYLVVATRGEAGQISDPSLANVSSLPFVRERETRCACEVYGIHPPIFLDYLDGRLTIVHQGQAVAKLVHLIRRLRPQVMISFPPDGIYGHYDHITVHRWSTIAFDLAADPDCFPGQLEGDCHPHQVGRLYYTVLTDNVLAAMQQGGMPAAVPMDGVPFPFVAWPQDQVSVKIDVTAFLPQKLRALACYPSQVRPDEMQGVEGEPPDWARYECFVLGRTAMPHPQSVQEDLFAGW